MLEAPISPNGQATTTDTTIIGDTSLSPADSSAAGTNINSNNDQISLYVVHQGDTLPAIAKMFGVSVNTIKLSNNIRGNTITVGETLVILPVDGVEHVVKKGDTLQSIAKQYKADVADIVGYNDLAGTSLTVGETIIIPGGSIDEETTPPVSVGHHYNNQGVGSEVCATYTVLDGYYGCPVIGAIKTQGIHGHNAVDLAAPIGTDIMASAAGTVVIARDSGWNGGYGEYVAIQHDNGTETVYGHMSKVLVSAGDTVTQGQVIGKIGMTGHATGPHVHFEIRGGPVNPF